MILPGGNKGKMEDDESKIRAKYLLLTNKYKIPEFLENVNGYTNHKKSIRPLSID